MRNSNFSSLLDCLSSSVFRRWLRLYLPTIVSTFISMLFTRWDWYVRGLFSHHTLPPVALNFSDQFWHWINCVLLVGNPFQNIDGFNLYSPPYDGHLWTIPIEFRGSIVVFVTLLGLSRTKPTVRIIGMAAIVIYTLCTRHWDLFLFLCGMLLAEVDLWKADVFLQSQSISLHRGQDLSARSIFGYRTRRLLSVLACFMFLFAVHVLGLPASPASTPGYRTMMLFTPSQYSDADGQSRFWLAIGAVLLLASFSIWPSSADPEQVTLLQKPFTTPFAQYLGHISYAIYMVHGPILFTFGLRILRVALRPEISSTTYFVYFVGASLANAILIFWAADLFWRGVDAQAVRFARWFSGKCWVRDR
jgi:peptidoglycan/LPS O-acetylase OafA/YrhL